MIGCKRQLGELNSCFVPVNKGVTIGADAQKTSLSATYIVGVRAGFFDGLRARRYSQVSLRALSSAGGSKSAQTRSEARPNDDSLCASTNGDDGDDSNSRHKQRMKIQ